MRAEAALGARAKKVRVLVAALVLLAGVGCSGDDGDDAAPRSTTTVTSRPRPSTTVPDPTVPAGAPVSPLTGLVAAEELSVFRPALAVKVDNLDIRGETARPQAGIADADVVFEEIVEGNITRLVAVFQSAIPERVGPVRSARTTDPILLQQLNRPFFAFSGGNGYTLGAVRASPLRNASWDAVPAAYGRDNSRRNPHNLFLTPGTIYAPPVEDPQPPAPIFAFRTTGEKLSARAKRTTGVEVTFGGGSASPTVTYQYDKRVDGWRRGQNGTTHEDDKGTVVAPRNVVILFTPYATSPADPKSPEAQTLGKGDAWVLSKGTIVGGTWERAAPGDPAILKDADGHEIELTPGRTWVELPRPGGARLLD